MEKSIILYVRERMTSEGGGSFDETSQRKIEIALNRADGTDVKVIRRTIKSLENAKILERVTSLTLQGGSHPFRLSLDALQKVDATRRPQTLPNAPADPTGVSRSRAVREFLKAHSPEISAWLTRWHARDGWVGFGPAAFLTAPGWEMEQPMEVRAFESGCLAWRQQAFRLAGSPFTNVSVPDHGSLVEAIRSIEGENAVDDRTIYRVLAVRPDRHGPRLTYGPGRYAEHVETSLYLEFEAAMQIHDALSSTLPSAALRAPRSDPRQHARVTEAIAALSPRAVQLPQREKVRAHVRPDAPSFEWGCVSTGVATLLVETGGRGGPVFWLHQRRQSGLAEGAGGGLSIVPTGTFQAPRMHGAANDDDFSLRATVFREFAEELLGRPEVEGSTLAETPIRELPVLSTMYRLHEEGRLTLHIVGLGLRPLTLAPALLAIMTAQRDDLLDLSRESQRNGGAPPRPGHEWIRENFEGLAFSRPFDRTHLREALARPEMGSGSAACLHVVLEHFASIQRTLFAGRLPGRDDPPPDPGPDGQAMTRARRGPGTGHT